MKNYILGLNTNSLIFALFNPDYKIINIINNKSTFGSANKTIIDMAVLLHSCEENERLLNALSMGIPTLEFDIKYKYSIYESDELSPLDIDNELLLSMKMCGLKLHDFYSANKKTNIGGATKNKLIVFDTSMTQIKQKLMAFCTNRIIAASDVNMPTPGTIILDGECLQYRNIITTLPMPEFISICSFASKDIDYQTKGNMFFLLKMPEIMPLEITYFNSDDSMYNRSTTIGHLLLLECCEGIEDSDVKNDFPNYELISSIKIPIGKIAENNDYIYPDNIIPLGRFAECNPEISIEDVVRKSTNSFNLFAIWNRQKKIFNMYDAIKPSIKDKQQQTKEYIINIVFRTSLLLNEINWRFDRPESNIDHDEVTKRIVDIFKYWLSIAIVWEINPDRFMKLDEERSNKTINNWRRNENSN